MRPLDPQNPSAELLAMAYAQGAFPMVSASGEIEWFSPDPRTILPMESFHVPASLRRVVRQEKFEVTSDREFTQVIRRCAAPRQDGNGTWIDERLIDAYSDLHRCGAAHSVEAWRDGELVGGLYGVHLGAAFFGESMFTERSPRGRDASKVCLVHLVAHLRKRGFELLDTQVGNPHIAQFSPKDISRRTYRAKLTSALARRVRWTPWLKTSPLNEIDELPGSRSRPR